MHRSTSRSSTTSTATPDATPVAGEGRSLLSVDVEEWYHNCWVPEFVHPELRGQQPEELDHLLPQLLDRFDRLAVRATFFVLGEVARRLPQRIREVSARGHEVACHDELHLRAGERVVGEFRRDLSTAKARLEDLLGAEVCGYRAPEWSLRTLENPRLRVVAELGFAYDSSLMPALGAGARSNPTGAARIRWRDGLSLLEIPPLTWGGALRLPAGGWCGRLAPPIWLARAAERARGAGRVALFVVHPWELVDRPCPGSYSGLARWFHDAGRRGFGERFDALMASVMCRETMAKAVVAWTRTPTGRTMEAEEVDELFEQAAETSA